MIQQPVAHDCGCWLNCAGGDGDVTVVSGLSVDDVFAGDCTLDMVFRYDTPQVETFGKFWYKYSTVGYRVELNNVQDVRAFVVHATVNLNYTTNNITFVNGTWYHLACVYDGTTKAMQIFVNGTEATYAINTPGQGAYQTDATLPLVMFGTPGTANNLTGAIAWARMSNTKRWTANFTAPDRCAVPALDGYTKERWVFNEGHGLTVHASMASPAADGTAAGTVSWGCT